MSMVVKNNLSALNTLNTLNKNSAALSKSLQKVSSGMKINSAADDASGYAISERMRVQIRSLDQANANTQNGSSMMKTAEGAVSSTVEILKTLKEKAINAANDSNTDADRQTIQKELDQSIDQINDNANVTFNGKYLVDGSKNTLGKATYTALSNQSLAEGTTAATKLTELKSRSGDDLEIRETDKVTVSYVQAGKTHTTTFQVKGEDGKIATLGDIFKNAEAIEKDNQIFADATNKSVLAAQVKDEVRTQAQADAMEQTIKDAKTTMDNEAATLATKSSACGDKATTASEVGKVSKAVDDYNTASAAWTTALGTTDVSGGQAIVVKDAATTDKGKYLDNVAASDSYKAVSSEAGTMMDAIKNKIGANDTSGARKAINDLTGAPTTADLKAAVAGVLNGGTDDEKAVINAFNNAVDAGTITNKTQAGTFLGDLYTKADAVATAKGNLTTNANDVVDKDGNAVGTAYAAYTAQKTVADDAKLGYENLTSPVLLTGKTVGLAASSDTVETASGQQAITITANNDGIKGQISGLNISITDSQGNVKKSANASLDAFGETIRAQNESHDNAISLQVGAKANQAIKVGLSDMRAEALGLQGADGTKLNISTQSKANAAINVLDNAIQKALDQQTTIGSVESRLEYTSSNLVTASENVTASESTIRDADMAKEMTQYTKNNVLLQAAQSMLAQANQSSSNVLSLLQ